VWSSPERAREDRQGWKVTGLAPRLGPRSRIRSSPDRSNTNSYYRDRDDVNQLSSQLEVDPEQIAGASPAASNHSARPTQNWTLRISIAILAPLLLLGLVEAGLRICDVGYLTDLTVPCTIQGHRASCYNLFFAAPFFPPS
jgi:hypothetical protein